ncbi:unnamed protein product [Closterium sp. NIES-53]
MYITLYFIVSRLPDSLRAVRDQCLALDPTPLTVDLLEQHLLAAETSVVAVGAARGTPRTPFFEGATAVRARVAGVVVVVAGVVVGAAVEVVEAVKAVAVVGVVAGVGAFGGVGGRSGGGGGSGGSGSGGGRAGGTQHGGSGGGQRQQQQRQSETPSPQQLQFGDEAERPRWAELLSYGVAIFDLDYDVILDAMYALSVSAEGDCYLCVPPDPGIEAAALGASESVLPGTAPAEALHTFTLDSGASRSFFRNSTSLTPLSAPIPVRLADTSGGPVLARSSTVLPCPAVPSGSLSACVDLHVYMDGSSPGHVHSSAMVEFTGPKC